MVALTNVQYNLIGRLADHYAVDKGNFNRSVIVAMTTGCAPVLAVAGVGSVLKVTPIFGSLAGGSAVTVLAGALTFAFGRVMQRHFEDGGDFENLDMPSLRKRLAEEMEEGKRIVGELRDSLPEFRSDDEARES